MRHLSGGCSRVDRYDGLVLETGLAWIPQNATLLSNASNLLLILTLLGQNRVILSSRHPRLQDYY